MSGVQNLQPMPVDPDLPSHTSLHDPKERTKNRLNSNYGTVHSSVNSGAGVDVAFKQAAVHGYQHSKFAADSQVLVSEEDSDD